MNLSFSASAIFCTSSSREENSHALTPSCPPKQSSIAPTTNSHQRIPCNYETGGRGRAREGKPEGLDLGVPWWQSSTSITQSSTSSMRCGRACRMRSERRVKSRLLALTGRKRVSQIIMYSAIQDDSTPSVSVISNSRGNTRIAKPKSGLNTSALPSPHRSRLRSTTSLPATVAVRDT